MQHHTSKGEVAADPGVDSRSEVAESPTPGKLSSSKLATKLGMKTSDMLDRFTAAGYLVLDDGKHRLTDKGNEVGCEFVARSRFGPYFLWPENLQP